MCKTMIFFQVYLQAYFAEWHGFSMDFGPFFGDSHLVFLLGLTSASLVMTNGSSFPSCVHVSCVVFFGSLLGAYTITIRWSKGLLHFSWGFTSAFVHALDVVWSFGEIECKGPSGEISCPVAQCTLLQC